MSNATADSALMEHDGQRTPIGTLISLSMMMLLQYSAWGVWLPTMANYLEASTASGGLGFSGGQIGWILGLAMSVGAVSAPFIAGQIADRFLNAEKALGILLVIGGMLNFSLYYIKDFNTFLLVSVLYSVCYMPTLALTNSLAFANLSNAEKQFPPVRMWGTVGWIVASNAFPLIWLQKNVTFTSLPPFLQGEKLPDEFRLLADSLRVSGIIGVCYGLWAMLMLPATPPKKNVESPLAFTRAFALLRHPGFLTVTLAALPISMIHNVYFMRTGPFLNSIGFKLEHVGPVMSIGQFSEIFFLAILGLMLKQLGYRWTLVLGGLAYVLRFLVFATATPDTLTLVAISNGLHGLCYGCFFAGAYLYVEKVAPKDIRHSAQTVFGIIILGVGPILSGFYNQYVLDGFKTAAGQPLYSSIWYTQAGIAAAAMFFVALFFNPGVSTRTEK